MTKNIMIVGVGGQGSLLASKLLGHLLLSEGYDVKVSEVHGMSQRVRSCPLCRIFKTRRKNRSKYTGN